MSNQRLEFGDHGESEDDNDQEIFMSTDTLAPLRKITSITILGETYDLAQNGGDYHLVGYEEPDAYCNPVARKVHLLKWLEEDRVQALLNLCGDSYSQIVTLEEKLSKANAALQREAEPDSKPRRPVTSRETSVGVVNVLEGKGEESFNV